MEESQNIEFKESWKDEYLKWICGFANAQGGKIYIGIDDNRNIVGVKGAKRLMEDIPNKIVTNLGIVADVNLLESNEGKKYVEINVEPSSIPISYHGVYHTRSGATKQELKGIALQEFVLKKLGKSWDEIAHDRANVDAIDRNAIEYFIKAATNHKRLGAMSKDADTMTVLQNLHLVNDEGKLRYSAILLFAKDPLLYFPSVQFKIGRFGKDATDLLFDDVVEGNILQMADRVLELLVSKYLISPIHYEGMQRIENLEIPEDALREVLYNSIVHKDYQGVAIQMKVYDDRIELWNPGILPTDFTVETLFGNHSSRPRNNNIANVFYRAGFIETWGRGIQKICESLEEANMYPPKIEQTQGGVLVTIIRGTKNSRRNKGGDPTSTLQVPYKHPTSTLQVQTLVKTIGDRELSVKEIMQLLELSDRVNFFSNYLNPAIQEGWIELVYPDQPRHPKQKYRVKRS